MGWKGGWEKLLKLGSEPSFNFWVIKIRNCIKTVWFESSESMSCELEEKLDRGKIGD